MRRFAAILLLLVFAVSGSGTALFCHELAHMQQDRNAAQGPGGPAGPAQRLPLHNDQNCQTHAQLHIPIVTAAWAPVAPKPQVLIGVAIPAGQNGRPQNAPQRIDCRGPPAC